MQFHIISRSILVSLFFLSLLSAQSTEVKKSNQKIIITHPRPEGDTDKRNDYPLKLLTLALSYSKENYQLNPSKLLMNQGRALQELEDGNNIDVGWSMSSIEREKRLLPIRIPIYKGLIGWRLLLIKANSAKKFKKILAIDELKKLQAGQGHDWPDTKILESNGFKVTGVVNYESLFKMLELNRIDYFSRSIAEIGPEEKIYKKYNILIEPSIAIHYPSVAYFFVNKKNIKLASAVELGLEKAIADGSFDKLFHKYYDDFLVKSKIKNRRIFELNNPLLPDNVPLSRKNLWVNPRAL